MARNLIVCCDGTWNTPTQQDRGQQVPSNVVKMARAILEDAASDQRIYYDAGVGTGNWVDKATGGLLGTGLSDNILQAYAFIADNYQDGDQIYLFGFSRGAYSVRSLAGLIGRCGLTPPGDRTLSARAYRLYRQSGDEAGAGKAEVFKSGQRTVQIHFLGVWDTVGALGVPALSRYGLLHKTVRKLSENSRLAHGFHDETLGRHVSHAYQALAIDEWRGPFAPSLWKTQPGQARSDVEQVWFAGAHSNIGGGYLDCGLSDHAFMWMAAKALKAGLRLDLRYLSMRIDPNCHGELRDSRTGVYKLLWKHLRQIGLDTTLNERIHHSALRRFAHPTNGYAPANLRRAIAMVPVTEEGADLIERIREALYPRISTSADPRPEAPEERAA